MHAHVKHHVKTWCCGSKWSAHCASERCAKQRVGTGIDGQDGIDKNWLSFSVRGHSNRTNRSSSIRDRSDSSNCRSSSPGVRTRVRASILPSHTKMSPFVLHRVSDCCFFFIILPWPQRPKNALTSTLTLSGSFFEHLTGGWFRNRFALPCDWCSVLQRAFSQSARKAVFFLFHRSVLCCGQPSRVFRYICHPVFVFFELRNLRFPSPTRERPRVHAVPLRTVFSLCFSPPL